MEHPDRVLFIRLSAIGDILLATPLIRLFSEYRPQTKIDILTREQYVPLLEHHPLVSRVIPLRQPVTLKELVTRSSELRKNRYAMVFDLQKHWRSYLISWLSAPRKIYRYNKYALQRFFLVYLNINLYPDPPVQVPQRYFEAFEDLGITRKPGRLELFVPDEIGEWSRDNWPFKNRNEVVIIAPGAGRNTKKWPAKNFVELIRALHRNRPCDILLLGGPEDSPVCDGIATDTDDLTVNWCGKTSLLETAAVLNRADLVITHDTGLMHMAAAMQANTIAIFGPTVREFGFFPYNVKHSVIENLGLDCRPCSYHGTASCPKGHFRCMKEINPERVLNAALDFLSS